MKVPIKWDMELLYQKYVRFGLQVQGYNCNNGPSNGKAKPAHPVLCMRPALNNSQIQLANRTIPAQCFSQGSHAGRQYALKHFAEFHFEKKFLPPFRQSAEYENGWSRQKSCNEMIFNHYWIISEVVHQRQNAWNLPDVMQLNCTYHGKQ